MKAEEYFDAELGGNAGRWIDPFPEVTGVLLSDYIRTYTDRIRLIDPFEERLLKPASYSLRLGTRYYKAGHYGDLRHDESLELLPNSIVFVSTIEKINLPYYMIARFNLKIDMIYQGLLLGTGPQVDPGFASALSCPLHNISSNPIRIRQGETFATIDFMKTTPFTVREPREPTRLKEWNLYESDLVGPHGRFVLFPPEKRARNRLDDYLITAMGLAQGPIDSSVDPIDKRARRALSIAKLARRRMRVYVFSISVAGLIALLALWIGSWSYYGDSFSRLKQSADAVLQTNRDLRSALDKAEQEKNRLTSEVSTRLNVLEGRVLELESLSKRSKTKSQ